MNQADHLGQSARARGGPDRPSRSRRMGGQEGVLRTQCLGDPGEIAAGGYLPESLPRALVPPPIRPDGPRKPAAKGGRCVPAFYNLPFVSSASSTARPWSVSR